MAFLNQLLTVMMKVHGRWNNVVRIYVGSDFFGFLTKTIQICPKIFRLVYGWGDNDGGTRGDLGPDPPHEDDTK